MQARETTNFKSQVELLSNFLQALSDKVREHINNLDPRLGILSSASFASIVRDSSTSSNDKRYHIQIHSKAFELTLDAHFRQHSVSFEYNSNGMIVREQDIESCKLDSKYYDDLLQACLSDLSAPRPMNVSNPTHPARGYGMFDASNRSHQSTQPFIKEIIYNWPQRQLLG